MTFLYFENYRRGLIPNLLCHEECETFKYLPINSGCVVDNGL